jgi:hypothetical protein
MAVSLFILAFFNDTRAYQKIVLPTAKPMTPEVSAPFLTIP